MEVTIRYLDGATESYEMTQDELNRGLSSRTLHVRSEALYVPLTAIQKLYYENDPE